MNCFLTTVCLLIIPVGAGIASNEIRLNSIGYLPDAVKRATIVQDGTNFAVVRLSDGVIVFEGKVDGPMRNADTREELYTADFSAFTDPGEYRLRVEGRMESAAFNVAKDLYQNPFRTVTRGMYLWRCGTAVSGQHQGILFQHGVCHTNKASLAFAGGEPGWRDGSRGWHDAGDYNKYVVNAGITVGTMLRAWDDFGAAIRAIPLGLPESGGRLPEFLAELKWELDWLFTMQASDGSVHHKLSTREFCQFIMPEDETNEQYFSEWSSAATADFTAMMAAAARAFRSSDPTYADRCLTAARAGYAFLQSHPENHDADLAKFKTGAYATSDPDDRLWAAAELWETTGDNEVLRDFEERARRITGLIDVDFDWRDVKNLGMFTYLFSNRDGRDPTLLNELRESLLATADRIVETRDTHGYARPLGTRYYWGCNGGVARQTMVLYAANRLAHKTDYRDTALDALNHLFGRNPYGRSFVTGLGHEPPLHPHDRRSGADNTTEPWPGYLVGGPNRGASSWEDEEANYRCNEIAINWNAAMIYALAAFLDESNWNAPEYSFQTQLDGEVLVSK